MRICSINRCSGFTLVEVLVAMTVAGVGMIAVFGALRIANSTRDRIKNQEGAQLLAEQRITSLLVKAEVPMGIQNGSEGKYSWKEEVRRAKPQNMAEVMVTVSWMHQGQSMEFQLVSLREMNPVGKKQ